MKIPFLNLSYQHEPIQDEIAETISGVIRDNAFILGEEVQKLEKRIAGYCQTEFAVGVSSGTDALLISLMALGIGPEDEVITTPFSFFATAGSIVRTGAQPVFADIDPVTYNIDPKKIEAKITPHTRAILPVHLYGQCADMEPILEIAEARKLFVIEDAAQALGAQYRDGRRAGNFGDLGCFSFFPSKNLGGFGDGGMVVTQDARRWERIRMLRVHGSQSEYNHKLIGGNFRLDNLQAAVLNVKMTLLEKWHHERRENAKRYEALFRHGCLVENGKVRLPQPVYAGPGVPDYHIYNQFVIRVRDRDKLREYLLAEGISTKVYYPIPFHLQECFRPLGHKAGDFPEAELAARETLALPVFPGLTSGQQEYIVERIEAFYDG
ncbi:MAG: DegT/DnrJ/EryC1/StrS family aminotransferase [Nitrospinaceae bacterium]